MRIPLVLISILGTKLVLLLGVVRSIRHLKFSPVYFVICVVGFQLSILKLEFVLAAMWLLMLFSSQYNVGYRLGQCVTNFTPIKYISFIIISIAIARFFRDGHLIGGIDKNIFTLVYVFVIIYVSNYRPILWREFALTFIFAFAVGSTNFVLFLAMLFLGKLFGLNFRRFHFGAFLVSNVFAIIYVYIAFLLFDFDDPSNVFFPASVIERGAALFQYIEFIHEFGVPVFSGRLEEYSARVVTLVHNDLLKMIVSSGLLFCIVSTAVQLKIMGALKMKFVDTFAVYAYSGILGGMGWFGGNMLLFMFLFLKLFEATTFHYRVERKHDY